MYGCPNCNNVFEPTVVKTVATEPFIRCPECGMSRALNSEVWSKDAKVVDSPPPPSPKPKAKAKKSTKSKKK
jgi:uncharacterized Zn finger protein